MISSATLKFLQSLKKNNNRDWFQAHRAEYEPVKAEFENVTRMLLKKIGSFHKEIAALEPKDCVFRIYRDIRFSHDKTPYKTHLAAFFVPGGKKSMKAGYYFRVEPGGKSLMAGGIHLPPPDRIKAIRQEIEYNADEFRQIIGNKKFAKAFGSLEGEKLKLPPKGYKGSPNRDLLLYKSYLAVSHVADKDLQSEELISKAAETFKTMHPLIRFINRSFD